MKMILKHSIAWDQIYFFGYKKRLIHKKKDKVNVYPFKIFDTLDTAAYRFLDLARAQNCRTKPRK